MPPCGDHALRSRSGLPRKSPVLGTLYGRTLGVLSVLSNTAVTRLLQAGHRSTQQCRHISGIPLDWLFT